MRRPRVWHSTELGEPRAPGRYVDIFQGRAPRTVIVKHYAGKGLARLKIVYEKPNAKIVKEQKLA